MKIQFVSDVHIEFTHELSNLCKSIAHTFEFIPQTDADVIVVAGDIWYQLHGIKWCEELSRLHNKPVVVIYGNHDYWLAGKKNNKGIDALIKAAREYANNSDAEIFFLENDELILDGVRFLGCTMWTSYKNGDPFVMMKARQVMADFAAIPGKITPADLLTRHKESRAWLTGELAKDFDGKTVVITHHAPSYISLSEWELHQHTAAAYHDKLEDLMFDYHPSLWIHGHVHRCNDYRMGGTRVVSNTRGYHGEQTIEGFDAGKIIEV